jgi:hypothetical protein
LPVAIFAVRRMDVRFEQRVNIKFCVKLGKTATCWLMPCVSISRPATKFCGRTWRLENIEAIQAAATMELTGIPKEAFTSCFQDLQKRWLRRELLRRGQEPLVVRLNFVFFTDWVSELYGQRMHIFYFSNTIFVVEMRVDKFVTRVCH